MPVKSDLKRKYTLFCHIFAITLSEKNIAVAKVTEEGEKHEIVLEAGNYI